MLRDARASSRSSVLRMAAYRAARAGAVYTEPPQIDMYPLRLTFIVLQQQWKWSGAGVDEH